MTRVRYTKLNTDDLIMLMCGFVCLSPFSAFLSNSLGFDATISEVFLIFFVPFLLRKLNLKLNWSVLLLGATLIFILLTIAIILGNFPLYSLLSTARGYFLLALGFACSTNSNFSLYDLKYLFLGSTLGWLFSSVELVNNIKMGNDESMVANGNYVALFGVVFLLMRREYSKIALPIGLFNVVYLVIFSGSRRTVFVVGAAVIVYFLLNIQKLKSWLILSSIFSVTIFSYRYIAEVLDNINPLMRYRLVDKLLNVSSNESDQLRVGFFDNWINGLYLEILPSGFISKRTFDDSGAGDFMDFPLSELTRTFGLILVLPFIILYGFKVSKKLIEYYSGGTQKDIIIGFGVLFVLLVFIEGSFLNFAFVTPMTGIILAKLLYSSFKNKNLY